MRYGGFVAIACILVLSLSGCILPGEFEAALNVKKDGAYEFSYDGTIVSLAMLSDLEDGTMDKEEEKKIAADIASEIEKMEKGSTASYLGNALFKVTLKKSGDIREQPLLMGMKEMPLFTFAASPDGTGAVFSFLPGIDPEAMQTEFPASGLSPRGTIVLTTELPVESSAGEPAKSMLSGTYTWKVDGIEGEMPAMTLKLK